MKRLLLPLALLAAICLGLSCAALPAKDAAQRSRVWHVLFPKDTTANESQIVEAMRRTDQLLSPYGIKVVRGVMGQEIPKADSAIAVHNGVGETGLFTMGRATSLDEGDKLVDRAVDPDKSGVWLKSLEVVGRIIQQKNPMGLPSWEGAFGMAIGNVVAHEIGHMVGLYHTADGGRYVMSNGSNPYEAKLKWGVHAHLYLSALRDGRLTPAALRRMRLAPSGARRCRCVGFVYRA